KGGEVRPKRPTAGKKKPGITFSETNHGRDTEPTNHVAIKSESTPGNHLSGSLPGSIVMRQNNVIRSYGQSVIAKQIKKQHVKISRLQKIR
ncbi:MAG: hypothetical protein U9R02_08455, partial [Thermodesulfobacteriota bacterium]|nr:hypothetical protein [Thermodesulfobacteriota bacterium]